MGKVKEYKCKVCGVTDISKFRTFPLPYKTLCKIHLKPYQNAKVKKCRDNMPKDKLKKQMADWKAKYRNGNMLLYKLINAKYRAKKKSYLFELDLDFLKELKLAQDNKCIYTGIEFKEDDPLYDVSIDRIDSSKGYTKDNVQLVTNIINYMKAEYPEEIFVEMCKKVYLNSIN